MNSIVDRIEREAGVPGLAALLAEKLEPTDLQSLLLETYRQRAARRTPAAVLSDFAANRFVRPSPILPQRLLEWDAVAFGHLPAEFEALDLSPVSPLGTNSVVAGVSQDWAVSTARNTEVVSDATNVLALEAALRRGSLLRADPRSRQAIHLAASHRVVRAQHYPDPSLMPHFRLFALCSAGRDLAGSRFEMQALALHLRFYLAALRAFAGPALPLRVSLSAFAPGSAEASAEVPAVALEVLDAIRPDFENVEYGLDQARTAGRGYYAGVCFHIHGRPAPGAEIQLVDGGTVGWASRLLNNAKERLFTSGIGSERLVALR